MKRRIRRLLQKGTERIGEKKASSSSPDSSQTASTSQDDTFTHHKCKDVISAVDTSAEVDVIGIESTSSENVDDGRIIPKVVPKLVGYDISSDSSNDANCNRRFYIGSTKRAENKEDFRLNTIGESTDGSVRRSRADKQNLKCSSAEEAGNKRSQAKSGKEVSTNKSNAQTADCPEKESNIENKRKVRRSLRRKISKDYKVDVASDNRTEESKKQTRRSTRKC